MSHLESRLLSIAIVRRDDRELEYQIGSQTDIPEGLNYHPPWLDPQPLFVSEVFAGTGGADGIQSLQPMWDDRVRYGGYNNLPYRITGVVQDSDGNPISNTVCSLFRTVDDQWMYDATSKDGGQYDFGVSDTTTQYYVVAFNIGLGKQGVTMSTLTGS